MVGPSRRDYPLNDDPPPFLSGLSPKDLSCQSSVHGVRNFLELGSSYLLATKTLVLGSSYTSARDKYNPFWLTLLNTAWNIWRLQDDPPSRIILHQQTYSKFRTRKESCLVFPSLTKHEIIGNLMLYSHATTADKCTKKRVMHVQSWLLLISCRSRYVHGRHCSSSLFLVVLDQTPCCRACKSLTI